MQVNISFKVPGLRALMDVLTHGRGFEKTLLQWGAIYRSFAQRRYTRASAGDGTWKPLKQTTINARRKGRRKPVKGAKRKVMILRDTGTMFKVLDPVFAGAPGAYQVVNSTQLAITLGYGGNGQHPSRTSRKSVAAIASYHQIGNIRLPKREIIVKPDEKTMKQMTKVAEKNLTDIGNGK